MNAPMMSAGSLPTYSASSAPGVPDCYLANVRPGQPLLVAIHGISRNAAEIAMRFAVHPAFRKVSIIAPLFTREGFGQYQQMATRKRNQTRSDEGLIRLLEEIAAEHHIPTGRFRLFGFSGGAQMAHRFAMFHPERVERLCAVSAGWYSLPRTDLAYPYGIGNGEGEPLVGPQFLDIPTMVIVGNRDTRVDESVRQDAEIVEHQGRNRLRRARCYVRTAAAYADSLGKAGRPQLLTLHGVSHDFTQCVAEGDLLEFVAQSLV
ncbi:MAG: alpha/beta hydrolase [Erythrobacter sp.]|jgi:pimeloyl-ACP methyl ester carboxylesterase|nr:alpha/beta hydrolase [Erythrobacter sp.]